MALGKYSRVDGRKSTNYCSTVTIVVFVALCLVGLWMMTSSSVVPVQNSDVASQQESKNDVNENTRMSKSNANENNFDNSSNENKNDSSNESSSNDNEGKSKQFEDNPGDLPEDATKGDNSVSSNQEEKNSNPQEKSMEENHEKSGEENREEEGSKSEDGSKSEKESEENVEPNSDEKVSEAGEANGSNASGESGDDNKPDENFDDTKDANKGDSQKVKNKMDTQSDQDSGEKKESDQTTEVFPSGAQSELLNETTTQNGAFSTQATESKNEKEAQQSSESENQSGTSWKLCNATAGADYIPCLDNLEALRSLHSTKHYEHRERHCPDNPPTCLVLVPEGYKRSIEWPTSREKVS